MILFSKKKRRSLSPRVIVCRFLSLLFDIGLSDLLTHSLAFFFFFSLRFVEPFVQGLRHVLLKRRERRRRRISLSLFCLRFGPLPEREASLPLFSLSRPLRLLPLLDLLSLSFSYSFFSLTFFHSVSQHDGGSRILFFFFFTFLS